MLFQLPNTQLTELKEFQVVNRYKSFNKNSAVARRPWPLATVDMGRKEGGCCQRCK